MGWAEMVVAIVAIGAFAQIARAKYGHGSGDWRSGRGRERNRFTGSYEGDNDAALEAENTALRDEMRAMKDRIQVLERLATDDEFDARRLDREIEKLRGTAAGKDTNGG